MLTIQSIEKDGSGGKVSPVTGRRVVRIIEGMAEIVAQDDQGRGLRLIDDEAGEIARVEYIEGDIKVVISPGRFAEVKTRVVKVYEDAGT